ncbi:glycosyltransferase [Collinsella sp. HCP28S3_E12]|uniref:glycosyltransferase n=1 Tax=Collinsella sp. HCP28S3_E12 TaxID=3438921 RepID=UPI003F8938B5
MNEHVEVLVAALGCDPERLIKKMNLQSDAVIANQCDENRMFELNEGNHYVRVMNFKERGVGLNRNNALMRARGDYCLIADDDMRYVDGYEDIVVRAFRDNPGADVLVFNLKEKTPSRYCITNRHRVHFYNFLRYGAARIAVRLSSIQRVNIYFHLQYGGGTPHSHGEDNIFLADCLKNGLKIVALPLVIAELNDERPSTWNDGYTSKYFIDQGALYRRISRKFWFLLCAQDAIRHFRDYGQGPTKTIPLMVKGGRNA